MLDDNTRYRGAKTGTLGGHFASWEQPALFSSQLRAAFRSLR
jgi:hypothetical protein